MDPRKPADEGSTAAASDSAVGGSLPSDQRWFARVWHWLSEAGRTATEREARAAALALASPQAVWQLLREMPVGLVLYDPDFRIVYQNPAGETMTGYPNAQFAGQSPVGLWMPDEAPDKVAEHLARMRDERVALRGRSMHVKKDGSHAWVQWYTTPLFDGETFLGYLGVHTNLSEEVRVARHQAELLIDAATDIAILQLSPEGRIESWTRSAASLFGRDAREALGRPLAELLAAPASQEDLAVSLLTHSQAGERAEYEGQLLRRDSKAFWAHVRLYPQRDDEGTLIAHTLIARDVSERVEAERALARYQAQLSALTHDLMEAEQRTNRRLAQALHDQLGQTFTSLRIFIDALRKRTPPNDPAVRQAWSEVSNLVDRGMAEVRQVLDELRPVLLEEQGLVVALDNEAQTQGFAHPEVRVRFLASPSLASRRWPPDAEYAAFMVAREAIGNALRHAGAGELRIALEALDGGFLLEVEDDGEGLPADTVQARPGHLGLVGMRERALGIGASLTVGAGPQGRGTRIALSFRP